MVVFDMETLFEKHKDMILYHYMSLSLEDRGNRFHHNVSDYSIINYVNTMTWDNRHCIGVIKDGVIIALGELITNKIYERGEIAVSVLTKYQNQGIGRKLVRELIQMACEMDIHNIHLIFVRGNAKMRSVAQDVNAKIEYHEGVYDGIIEV